MATFPSSPCEADYLDVNQSLKEQVLQAIKKVAAVQQDSDHSEDEDLLLDVSSSHQPHHRTAPGVAPKSLDDLHHQKVQCEGEVWRLEEEIRLLEDELQRRASPGESVTDEELETAIFSLARTQGEPTGASELSVEQDDKTIKQLNSQIKLNESFNGIRFKSVEWEVVDKRDAVLHRKHTHSGLAYGFEFRVQFIVQEESGDGSEPLAPADKARIIMLHTQVDHRIQKDLQAFLARTSRDSDLMKFYQTYAKYALLVHERKEIFKKAKSLHKRLVDLSEGSCGTRLKFTLPKGPSLHFTWNVDVSDQGYVDHALSLQIKDTHKASEDDRSSIAHLPQLLQRMATVQGHGQALLKLLAFFQ